MVLMCKMIISAGVFFFHFFKILIFWVVSGVKGQKMVQNDKKICLSHSTSQEPYIIRLLFMVHMSAMIIFSGIFLIFQNFDFLCCQGLERAKNAKNAQALSVGPYISGTIYHMILIYGTHG